MKSSFTSGPRALPHMSRLRCCPLGRDLGSWLVGWKEQFADILGKRVTGLHDIVCAQLEGHHLPGSEGFEFLFISLWQKTKISQCQIRLVCGAANDLKFTYFICSFSSKHSSSGLLPKASNSVLNMCRASGAAHGPRHSHGTFIDVIIKPGTTVMCKAEPCNTKFCWWHIACIQLCSSLLCCVDCQEQSDVIW